MNKTIKGVISLIAAVVVIAVMVGALLWQRSREPEEDEIVETPAQNVRLIQRAEDEVVKVTFTDSYGTVVMLPYTDEHDRMQWTMEGTDYVLNRMDTRNKIRGTFSLLASQLVHEDVSEVEINLADFGLNPPNMTITAYYADGTTFNIYLGSPNSDFTGYFMMIEDDPGLYIITAHNAARFMFGLEDMLDSSLPFWEAESISYLLIAQRDRDVIEISTREHDEFEGVYMPVMLQPFAGSNVWWSSFEDHIMVNFRPFALGDLVNMHPTSLAPYGLDNPSLEFIYRAPHGEAHLLFGDRFFRDINGSEVAFIYVKFADRPHVFEALYEPVSFMYDVNILRFIERFIAIHNIQYVERMEVSTPDDSFEIWLNHVEDSNNIEPTVNGIAVNVSDFRLVYRLVIGLGINAEITPFAPTGTPVYTVVYNLFEDEDTVLHFFVYDPNFLAVSVDGNDAWFVTSRREFDIFIRYLRELI